MQHIRAVADMAAILSTEYELPIVCPLVRDYINAHGMVTHSTYVMSVCYAEDGKQ